MKKWIVFLVLAIVVSNGWWLYTTIDNAVTLHYANDSIEFTLRTLEEAIRVANLNVIGANAEEVLKQLNIDEYGTEPFEKEGCIYFGQICLELDENRSVIEVR